MVVRKTKLKKKYIVDILQISFTCFHFVLNKKKLLFLLPTGGKIK